MAILAAKLALFLLGSALLVALARWWQPAFRWRHGAAYGLLVLAFLAPSLLTPGHQVGTDQLYRWRPWSETVEAPVRPANPLLADPVLQMLPFRTLVRERLLRGEAPLWANELGTGQPLLGDGQSAPFAPLHLAALPLPPLSGMGVAAGWQVLVGLLLTHLLLLHLGARPRAAAFAAVTYGLSCFAAVWLFYPLGMTAAWVPGLVLGVSALARGERGGLAGTVVCSLAMLSSGHPETVAHGALVAAVLVPVLAWRRPAADRFRFARELVLAGLLVALLAVPIVGPLLEALPESQRMAELAEDPAAAAAPPFQASMLAPLVHPFAFGSPRDGDWSGPWNFNELVPAYAGLPALLLALVGAVWWRGRILALFLGGAAALLAALALHPFVDLVQALPLLEHGAHGRLRLVWVLAVAVAAGLTLEAFEKAHDEAQAKWPGWLLASLAGGAAGLLVLLGRPEAPWQRGWWWAALAGLVVLAVLALVPRGRRHLAPVALGVLLLDLFLVDFRYNPALPYQHAPAASAPGSPPVLDVLVREASGGPYRVAAEDWDLPPNLAALYGLWDPRGNDPMRPAASAAYVARHLEGSSRSQASVRLRPGRFDFAALDDLGVRYLLTPHRRQMPPPWRLLMQDTGGKVWVNPQAKPVVFLPDGSPGSVEDLEVQPDGVRFRVEAEEAVQVASSLSWTGVWRATVDGRPVAAERYREAFVSVSVPAGSHPVVLRYEPRTWSWGRWSLLAGVLLAVGLAVRRRHRPFLPDESPEAAPR